MAGQTLQGALVMLTYIKGNSIERQGNHAIYGWVKLLCCSCKTKRYNNYSSKKEDMECNPMAILMWFKKNRCMILNH
jgi:hypothetical protein